MEDKKNKQDEQNEQDEQKAEKPHYTLEVHDSYIELDSENGANDG